MSNEITPQTYSGKVSQSVGTFTEDQISACIKAGVIPDQALANKANIDLFFFTCREIGANPFLKQAHLIPIGGKFTVVVDYKFLRAKCAKHPAWGGQSKITYDGGKSVRDFTDNEMPKTAEVTVYRIIDGKRFGEEVEVSWREYGRNTSIWREKPFWMLGKVAMKKACEITFPECCEGLYIPEEFDGGPAVTITDQSGNIIQDQAAFTEAFHEIEAATTAAEVTELAQKYKTYMDNADFAKLVTRRFNELSSDKAS